MIHGWIVRLLLAVAFTAALLLLSPIAYGQTAAAPLSGSEATMPTSTSEDEASSGGWGWIPLPKITWPRVPMPKIEVPKMPESTFAPVRASAKKISGGAKKAWEGTKELFSFATVDATKDASQTRVASRPEPSFWQRLKGGEPEPEGPSTIGEFMAGERPR